MIPQMAHVVGQVKQPTVSLTVTIVYVPLDPVHPGLQECWVPCLQPLGKAEWQMFNST
jgi:hypothetical protein